MYVVKLQSKTLNLGCKTLKYLLTFRSQNVFHFTALKIWACVYYMPMFLVFSSETSWTGGKKVTQARKGLGTNSVGLATKLSLVFKLLQRVIPGSRGAFCCACSVNFNLIRETAGMRLRRFPAQESRKKRRRKIRRKKQCFEYLRQLFFSFFLQ